MPRFDANRGLSIPYRPGSPVGPGSSIEERLRNVWDELARIAIATAALDEPVSTSLNAGGTVQVTTGPAVWTRIFNGGFTVEPWVNPNNSFDPLTGVYTIPQEGVYAIHAEITISEHSTPATKGYYGGIRATVTPLGEAQQQFITYAGGFDNVPLSIYYQLMRPARKGTRIYFEIAAVHSQTVGPEQWTGSVMIIRQSGTGNNVA